jgi:hypothetical protein
MNSNQFHPRFSLHQVWLSAALALAACSPVEAAIAPPHIPTVEPQPTATVAPAATSTVAPSATEAPAAAATEAPANSPFPTGKFMDAKDETVYFLFGEDGRWSHHAGGATLATGEYRVEGDIYIQTKNSHGCVVPMSFKYTFDGRLLHFNLTEESQSDPCDARPGHYNDRIYILAE